MATPSNLHDPEQARLRATIEALKRQRDDALNSIVTLAGDLAAARAEANALRARMATMAADRKEALSKGACTSAPPPSRNN